MNRADEGVLAWALLESATAILQPAHRATLCTKIGAGYRDNAIRDLLACFANTQAELPFELAAPIRKWIQGYAGSDREPILQNVYGRIRVSARKQPAAAGGSRNAFDRSPHRLVAKRSEHALRSTP